MLIWCFHDSKPMYPLKFPKLTEKTPRLPTSEGA